MKVLDLYQDPDPGVHGAAEWLLRQWKQQDKLKEIDEQWGQQREQRQQRIKEELARDKDRARPKWYVTGHGQTMVVVPGPVDFWMGSPSTEAGRYPRETLHRQRIGRTFAIAAKSVTVEQFRRYLMANAEIQKEFDAGGEAAMILQKYNPERDCPISGVSWYMAAAYCNWLSEQEGLSEKEWCYLPNPDGKYGEGMKLAPAYLQRTGYRMPTEAEWEYACRSGATTSRYYGESEELLPKYAWHQRNAAARSRPVGSLKPNDLGLFDMHGNVWSWCQVRFKDYATGNGDTAIEDKDDALTIFRGERRVVRGGSFTYLAVTVRSANRGGDVPAYHHNSVGFRAARTFAAE